MFVKNYVSPFKRFEVTTFLLLLLTILLFLTSFRQGLEFFITLSRNLKSLNSYTVACDRNLDFFDAQRLILVPTCSLSRGLSENVNKKIQPSGTFWVRTRFKILDLKFPKNWHKNPRNYRKFKFDPGFVISSKFQFLT